MKSPAQKIWFSDNIRIHSSFSWRDTCLLYESSSSSFVASSPTLIRARPISASSFMMSSLFAIKSARPYIRYFLWISFSFTSLINSFKYSLFTRKLSSVICTAGTSKDAISSTSLSTLLHAYLPPFLLVQKQKLHFFWQLYDFLTSARGLKHKYL